MTLQVLAPSSVQSKKKTEVASQMWTIGEYDAWTRFNYIFSHSSFKIDAWKYIQMLIPQLVMSYSG